MSDSLINYYDNTQQCSIPSIDNLFSHSKKIHRSSLNFINGNLVDFNTIDNELINLIIKNNFKFSATQQFNSLIHLNHTCDLTFSINNSNRPLEIQTSEESKSVINKRNLSLKAETSASPSSYCEEKLSKKRDKNRDAARKCRLKKLERIANLEKQVNELKESNQYDSNYLIRLNEEIKLLASKIDQYN